MVNIGTAVAYLELDTSKFSSGISKANDELKVFQNKNATAEQKINGLQNAMKTAGSAMTKSFTLPLVGAGAAAFKVGSDFEAGMSKVKAISGATAPEMELLTDKAIEMGAKTKFSASESADAFTYMAMAGWDANAMLEGISGIMNLAAADGLDLATTSDIVTDALTAFGMSAEESGHFADILAKASSSANTNVSMLGESFKYVAPVAGALGYSAEDTATALGLMANAGIKGSQAGTVLRTVLTNMANPTETMANAMNYLGVSLDDGQGNMLSLMEVMKQLRVGLGNSKMSVEEFDKQSALLKSQLDSGALTTKKYNDAYDDLIKKTFGAEGATKAMLASQLAGKEGMSGLLAIVNASDEDFEKLTNQIYNCDGTAEDMANTMQDNVQGSLTILGSTLETTGIRFYNFESGPIRAIIDGITNIISHINSLSDTQLQIVAIIAAVVAAIGPLLLIGSKLIAGFQLIQGWIGTLSGLLAGITAPIYILIAAVALLALAWITDFGGIRDTTATILEAIKTIISTVLDVIFYIWENNLFGMRETAEVIWYYISEIFETVMNIIQNTFELFINIFTGNWSGAWENVKNIASGIWDAIKNLFNLFLDAIINLLVGIAGTLYTSAIDVFTQVQNGFTEVWEKIKAWFDIARKDPIGALKGIFSEAKSAGRGFFDMIWEGMKSIWNDLMNWVNDKVDWLISKVKFWEDKAEDLKEAKEAAREEKKERKASKGHRSGLSYVPYDGYSATLHTGERVLTQEENEEYTRGRNGNNNFYFYGTPPLDEKETARQFKKSQQELALGL